MSYDSRLSLSEEPHAVFVSSEQSWRIRGGVCVSAPSSLLNRRTYTPSTNKVADLNQPCQNKLAKTRSKTFHQTRGLTPSRKCQVPELFTCVKQASPLPCHSSSVPPHSTAVNPFRKGGAANSCGMVFVEASALENTMNTRMKVSGTSSRPCSSVKE